MGLPIKICTKCVMPETKPDLTFDEHGVCDACRWAEKKQNASVDWKKRKKEFESILKKYKSKDGSNYDCIVPVSGGKDSTYQVHIIRNIYGLRPLCVCFEPTLPTPLGRKNLKNLNNLGVDLIHMKRNPVVYRELVRKGFERVGDNEWPNHVGIFTTPVQIAVKFNTPLIIWGENPQDEYGGPVYSKETQILDRRWLEEFGGLLGNRVEDMVNSSIHLADLKPYIYPSDEELRKVGVAGVYLGYFFPWDVPKQLKIVKKLGFSVKENGPVETTFTNFENLDCYSMSIHDYFKYLKYGFGRATDHACMYIRNGLISRDEAIVLVKKYDGNIPREALQHFLRYLDMTQEKFFNICDRFTHRKLFKRDTQGNFIRDITGNVVKYDYDY